MSAALLSVASLSRFKQISAFETNSKKKRLKLFENYAFSWPKLSNPDIWADILKTDCKLAQLAAHRSIERNSELFSNWKVFIVKL